MGSDDKSVFVVVAFWIKWSLEWNWSEPVVEMKDEMRWVDGVKSGRCEQTDRGPWELRLRTCLSGSGFLPGRRKKCWCVVGVVWGRGG